MKQYLVERNLPGAENLSAAELDGLARTFCDSASRIDKFYSWVLSYITEDKIYCIVSAESEEAIRDHAREADMPVNIISKVKTVIAREITTDEVG